MIKAMKIQYIDLIVRTTNTIFLHSTSSALKEMTRNECETSYTRIYNKTYSPHVLVTVGYKLTAYQVRPYV